MSFVLVLPTDPVIPTTLAFAPNQSTMKATVQVNADNTAEGTEMFLLRLLNPTLRVSTLKDVLGPFRRAEDLSRLEEGLRLAGLPE